MHSATNITTHFITIMLFKLWKCWLQKILLPDRKNNITIKELLSNLFASITRTSNRSLTASTTSFAWAFSMLFVPAKPNSFARNLLIIFIMCNDALQVYTWKLLWIDKEPLHYTWGLEPDRKESSAKFNDRMNQLLFCIRPYM